MTESYPNTEAIQVEQADAKKEHVPSDWAAEGPIPPRFWWLKRLGVVIGLLVLVLVGLRSWWGWDAHRRLQAEIDKIVAAGEPIYPLDFDPPEPVPDAENAAKFLLDAQIAMVLSPNDEELIEVVLEDRQALHQRLDEVAVVIGKNGQALDLVRRARSCTGSDWGLRFRTPAISAMLPPLPEQRWLAKLLSVASGYHHANGDGAAVAETLLDALAQVRAVESGPTMISHMVAITMGALTVNRVEEVTPSLVIRAEADTIPQGDHAASRRQIGTLIAELLAEDGTKKAFLRAMQSERMEQLDTVKAIVDGRMTPNTFFGWGVPAGGGLSLDAIGAFMKRPLYELDAIFGLAWMTDYVEAARCADWPTAVDASPIEPGKVTPWEQMLHPISWTALPSLKDYVVLHFRELAVRRMAAAALAIRLHEIDHGEWPSTLADLAPEYLPAVPADPFADDGRPIGYRPDAEQPVLYSIGVDGVDDEGVFMFNKFGGINWDELDIPFFLDGNRPREREP